MSWKNFYQGIKSLKEWWKEANVRRTSISEDMPSPLLSLNQTVTRVRDNTELANLENMDIQTTPMVGLCGFQSAGKTDLVKSFLKRDSPLRYFFVSTHNDTTSPIIYIRFSSADGPLIKYRFLPLEGSGSFTEIWDRIYAETRSEKTGQLRKTFGNMLQTFRREFAIEVEGKSHEFIEILALSTVIKDSSHVTKKLQEANSQVCQEVLSALSGAFDNWSKILELGNAIVKLAGLEQGELASLKDNPAKYKLKVASYIFSILIDSVEMEAEIFSPQALKEISEAFVLVDAPGFADCGVDRNQWGILTDWQAKRNSFLIGSRATHEFDILLLCVNASKVGSDSTGDLVNLRMTLHKYEEDLSKVNDWLTKRVITVFTVLDLALNRLIWKPVKNIESYTPAQKVREILDIPIKQQVHSINLPEVPFIVFQTPEHLQDTVNSLREQLIKDKFEELEKFFARLSHTMIQFNSVESGYITNLSQALKGLVEKALHQKITNYEPEFYSHFFSLLNSLIDLKGLEAARSRLFGGKWEQTRGLLEDFKEVNFDEIIDKLHKVSDPEHLAENLEEAVKQSKKWSTQSADESFVEVDGLRQYWNQVFTSGIPESKLKEYEAIVKDVERDARQLEEIFLKLR